VAAVAAPSFALAVDRRFAEFRVEMLRDLQALISEWDQSRSPETFGRIEATLEHLGLALRADRSVEA
jgi:hypothetical protein